MPGWGVLSMPGSRATSSRNQRRRIKGAPIFYHSSDCFLFIITIIGLLLLLFVVTLLLLPISLPLAITTWYCSLESERTHVHIIYDDDNNSGNFSFLGGSVANARNTFFFSFFRLANVFPVYPPTTKYPG
jgi:hypothetical protein